MKQSYVAAIIIFCVWLAATPRVCAQSEIVSMGYDIPGLATVARGQVITLFVRGLKAPDAIASGATLPTTLAGVAVRVKSDVGGYPERLPIFSIKSHDSCAGRVSVSCPLTHVTVQIPTEPTCVSAGQVANECTIGAPRVITLVVEESGVLGQELPVIVINRKPQILNACQTIFGGIGGICDPFVTHADGKFISSTNPARPGETIVIYAAGLGPTNPPLKTGEAAAQSNRAIALLDFRLIISFRIELPPSSPAPPVVWSPVEGWVEPVFVGLVPGYVGLYQINVTLPSRLPEQLFRGCTNTRIAVGAGFDGPADGVTFVDFCVQPQ